jgi:predicted AAA+ superfamily ATPase
MKDKVELLKKYSFSKDMLPELGLLRPLYTKKIMEALGSKLIKVLVGQRRAGKSYVLRQIIYHLIKKGVNPKNIIYINREYSDFDFLIDNKALNALIKAYRNAVKPKGRIYLFIDEIQDILNWERAVASFAQNPLDNCEVFITGSNSKLLAGELATLITGRFLKYNILPFSFQEYCEAKKYEKTKQNYLNYLNTGGLPELCSLDNQETQRNYVSNVKDTILLRDIIQRYSIKDVKLLDDLFSFLVNNASNLISIPNIVDYYTAKKRKTTYDTIATYISYIENAFLVHKIDRYQIKGKETLSGSCKYYINDLSFKNYLYQGFSLGVSYLLENAVCIELLRAGYTVYTGNIKNKEVDFVALKNGNVLYLQVAYVMLEPQTIVREYSALQAIPDNYEKYVVTLDDVKNPPREGIKHIQAWELSSIL